MRLTTLLLLITTLLGVSGCDRIASRNEQLATQKSYDSQELKQQGLAKREVASNSQSVSLNQADSANAASRCRPLQEPLTVRAIRTRFGPSRHGIKDHYIGELAQDG